MLNVPQRVASSSAGGLVYSCERQPGCKEMNNGCFLQHRLSVVSGELATDGWSHPYSAVN